MLGNPPWEKIKLQEKEWFAERSPTIASASTAAQRRKMISELRQSDPQLHAEFLEAKRQAEGESKFVRGSGRFPLCSRGDVNTFALFAELAKSSIGLFGRVGCVIPTAIVTDETTKFFFQDMMQRGSLVSLYDFENSAQLFPGVHRSYKFCLLTISGSDTGTESQFVFFAKVPQDISITDKQFTLSNHDLSLLNPNTLTCPIFRSRRDAELTKFVHSRLPVLRLDNSTSEQETWDLSFARLFDMTNDSSLFRKQDELLADDWELWGNSYIKNGDRMFPVLEGKMVGMWNSRAADIRINAGNVQRQQVAERLSAVEFADPARYPIPFLWGPESAARERTPKDWNKQWFVVFKRVTAATNERMLVGCIIPWTTVSYTLYVVTCAPHNQKFLPALAANLLSFPCDYILRQKTAQPSLPMGVVYESAFVAPSVYSSAPSFCSEVSFLKWLLPRVLELTYTAWDLEAFALDCDYSGPPFRWDEERRFLLRCELDAAYFHLYLGTPAEWGSDSPQLRKMFLTPRDAVDYIMETFPIVKRKDIKRTEIQNEEHEVTTRGTYITKDTILEFYDEMGTAIETGQAYQTRLDPPPGPPSTADGNFIPAGEWDEANWPPHIHETMQTSTK